MPVKTPAFRPFAAAVAPPSGRPVAVGDACQPAVVPMPAAADQLQEVHFGQTPWLTVAHAEQLLERGKDITCERPGDAAFAAELADLRWHFAGR